ncbi:MAG: FAD/NAD(P)-binding protein [Deltaproteobacteria bacterium]|nr:FAD/NAD(P)-binding protein [Deltaproteobacteria bacterium]
MKLYGNPIEGDRIEPILENIESPYLPTPGIIERALRVTEKEKFFTVTPLSPRLLDYRPGQFFMVGLPGYGEAPISVTSAPGSAKTLDLCIRAVGNLTDAVHRLGKGDWLWIRGPFGTSFPLHEMKGKDIIFVAGGIGIVPMRSLIKAVVREHGFGKKTLIYGSKSPEEMLFTEEMEDWRARGCDVQLTIDKPHPEWGGNVGVVTTLIPKLKVREGKTIAVIIGPPVMYKFVILSLKGKLIGPEHIFVSLERRMRCGVGKCGHCQINGCYVCQEGPVFKLSELKDLPEAI